MKAEIIRLNKDSEAVEALLKELHKTTHDKVDFNNDYGIIINEYSDNVDIMIYCNGIIVNNDRISIEFLDGVIADYEIKNIDYWHITIQ